MLVAKIEILRNDFLNMFAVLKINTYIIMIKHLLILVFAAVFALDSSAQSVSKDHYQILNIHNVNNLDVFKGYICNLNFEPYRLMDSRKKVQVKTPNDGIISLELYSANELKAKYNKEIEPVNQTVTSTNDLHVVVSEKGTAYFTNKQF